MSNEEHGARNGVGIDHGRDSAALRPCFPLLSSYFLLILSIPSSTKPWNPFLSPIHAYL